jgi:hypothetical protein
MGLALATWDLFKEFEAHCAPFCFGGVKKKKAFNQRSTSPSDKGSDHNLWKSPSMITPQKAKYNKSDWL